MGFATKSLLRIQKIFSAIRNDWIQSDFMEVDTENFEIELMIFGRLQKLCDIKSRRLYDYFTEDLQKEYTLHVTDGNCQFDLGMTELKETFTRMKCAMLCNKKRGFQYKQLQGAV